MSHLERNYYRNFSYMSEAQLGAAIMKLMRDLRLYGELLDPDRKGDFHQAAAAWLIHLPSIRRDLHLCVTLFLERRRGKDDRIPTGVTRSTEAEDSAIQPLQTFKAAALGGCIAFILEQCERLFWPKSDDPSEHPDAVGRMFLNALMEHERLTHRLWYTHWQRLQPSGKSEQTEVATANA